MAKTIQQILESSYLSMKGVLSEEDKQLEHDLYTVITHEKLSEEQILELSKKVLGDYIKKASNNMAHHQQFGQSSYDRADNFKKHGMGDEKMRAAFAQVDYDKSKEHMATAVKRRQGITKAVNKLTKEDLSPLEKAYLNELSKPTLKNYAHTASMAAAHHMTVAANTPSQEAKMFHAKKGSDRIKGVMRATKKLNKEQVEYITSILDDLVEEMITEITIDHSRYVRNHGKKAGGQGSWMFTHKHKGDANYDDEKEVHQVNGKFSEASKSAKEWAAKHGHKNVYVMESSEVDEDEMLSESFDYSLADLFTESELLEALKDDTFTEDEKDCISSFLSEALDLGKLKGGLKKAVLSRGAGKDSEVEESKPAKDFDDLHKKIQKAARNGTVAVVHVNGKPVSAIHKGDYTSKYQVYGHDGEPVTHKKTEYNRRSQSNYTYNSREFDGPHAKDHAAYLAHKHMSDTLGTKENHFKTHSVTVHKIEPDAIRAKKRAERGEAKPKHRDDDLNKIKDSAAHKLAAKVLGHHEEHKKTAEKLHSDLTNHMKNNDFESAAKTASELHKHLSTNRITPDKWTVNSYASDLKSSPTDKWAKDSRERTKERLGIKKSAE